MDLVLLVQPGILISDGDYLQRMLDFLPADTSWVTRNPEKRSLRSNRGVEVCITFNFWRILDAVQGMGHKTAHSGVVCVLIWAEKLCKDARLLVGGRESSVVQTLLHRVHLVRIVTVLNRAGRVTAVGLAQLAALQLEEALLFSFQILGKIVDQGLQGTVQRQVVKDKEDKEDDLQDQRSNSHPVGTSTNGEQTDEADNEEVASGCSLLQSPRINLALSVNFRVGDVEQVVSIGEVEQIETNGSETQDQRGDAGVRDG